MARPPSTRRKPAASTRRKPAPATPGRAKAAAAEPEKAPAERGHSPTVVAASQKRYLRSLAHDLKPVILVGAKGVTPAMLAEFDLALERHELVKVKLAAPDRDERDAWVSAMIEASGAALVQRVGNIATAFRPRRKDPGIVLPR